MQILNFDAINGENDVIRKNKILKLVIYIVIICCYIYCYWQNIKMSKL